MEKNTVSDQGLNSARRQPPQQAPKNKEIMNESEEGTKREATQRDSVARRKEDGPTPEFGKAVETDHGTIEDVPEEAAP